MAVYIRDIVKAFNMRVYNEGPEDRAIDEIEINRCGLQLSGYFGCFEEKRVQMIGNAEDGYLGSLSEEQREKALEALLKYNIPCIVMTNRHEVPDTLVKLARKHNRWVLGTDATTSRFHVELTVFLQNALAETISMHGNLVDIYGVGVLITGNSGIGKSETSLDLIRNGHLLIADDCVMIKKLGANLLEGTGSEVTKNYMEIRGIGIININSLYGLSAIRIEKNIEVVINLEQWNENEHYERVGMNYETTEILGVKLPYMRVPVKPGRNLAAIIEVAALNFRQNLMGNNSAMELDEKILMMNKKQDA